jgi:hypothetical protein
MYHFPDRRWHSHDQQMQTKQQQKIFGTSDASFHPGKATHVWVISSGDVSDLETLNMTITGNGAMDGYSEHMSSGGGELHGIMALSIMSDILFNFHNFNGNMTAVCDNQGVIKKCDNPLPNNLWRYHDTNHDLYITQRYYRKQTKMKLEWVKGNTDKIPWTSTADFLLQKLGKEEIFNILCDCITQQTWNTGATGIPDQAVSHIKRWSVYAGKFNSEICTTLSY